jgi:hypothetical protein
MSDEVAFSVIDGNVQQLPEVSLGDIGFRERQDLQRWIEEYPEIVGPDLLIVTTEFDRWEFGTGRVRDRLDVLFLDSTGSLIVAELKRGEAPDTVDLQALKYAAYCSQLTVNDVVGDYARYYDTDEPTAREALFEHAPSLETVGLGPVKVRLVAEAFKPSVTSMVLWLRDYDLDIGCVEISARRLPDGVAVISSRQLLPLPVAEDYLVRRRRRERDEEAREASARRPNVVAQLLEADAIEAGTELTLELDAFSQEERVLTEQWLQENPDAGRARWTALGARKALRWRLDGHEYSASRLIVKMLSEQGFDRRSAPGPRYWKVPDGRTLVEVADGLGGPTDDSNSEETSENGPLGG